MGALVLFFGMPETLVHTAEALDGGRNQEPARSSATALHPAA